MLHRLRNFIHRAAKPESQEQEKEELVLASDTGLSISRMCASNAWKMIQQELEQRFNRLQAELRIAKLDDIVRLQAQLTELEYVMNLAPRLIEAGAVAADKLESILQLEKTEE